MRKSIILLGCLIFVAVSLQAQSFNLDAPKTFVTIQVAGTVNLKNVPRASKLSTGMVLPENAILKVLEGGSATLTMDGHMLTFDEAGTYKLKKEAKKLKNVVSEDSFLSMVNLASGHNKGGGGDSTQDGWGQKLLSNIMPIDGAVGQENTTFSWEGASPNAYVLTIVDASNDQTVFSARTKSKKFNVDLSQLDLKQEAEYLWHISEADKPDRTSKKSDITIVHPKEVQAVIDNVKMNSDYQNSEPWLQVLREAHALDENKMLLKAYETYMMGVEKFPDNELMKDMASKFLSNHGLGDVWFANRN